MTKSRSLHHATGGWLPDINITNEEKASLKRMLNSRFNHSEEQLQAIFRGIEGAIKYQTIADKEYELNQLRPTSPADINNTLKKLQGHLDSAQTIIERDFTAHLEGLIEQHYYLNTREWLPNRFQLTDIGPVQSILCELIRAIEKASNDYPTPTKNIPKEKSSQYVFLIKQVAEACKSAD